MSIPLEEALAQVDLKSGRSYSCKVNGYRVTLQVTEEVPDEMLPAPLVESDIMLEPWVEFPFPSGGVSLQVRAVLGEMPLPDRPIIPDDEDYS